MSHYLLDWLPRLLWCLVGAALAFGVFGRAWLRQLLESEGVPSIRLTVAAVVVVFCLFMDAAGRLTDPARTAWLGFAEVLLGLGIVKVVASRFAPKPTTDLTEKAAEKTKDESNNP